MKKIMIAALLCAAAHAGMMAQTNRVSNKNQMDNKKQFSLLVRVPVTYTTVQAQEAGARWDQLLSDWKKANAYVLSFAFPGESRVVQEGKDISTLPVVSDNLRVVSNIVLRCVDIDEAIAHAKRCPVLPYGGSVEVREIPRGVTYGDH